MRRPGDAENTLRMLLHQLRLLAGVPAAEKEIVMLAGKAHLEELEQGRRLYIRARALSVAQVRECFSARSHLNAVLCAMSACLPV